MQATTMGAKTPDRAALVELIDRHRPGWSLEQAFYVDPAIFEFERELWFPRQWSLVAHASEVPEKGRYIVRQIFDEEIIVVRFGDAEEDVAAYYNVCTHRGSRLCTKDGRSRLLVCPYHAWSYRLTGELQTRQDVPENVDPEALGLHRAPTTCVGGLVLCGLEEASLPDVRPLVDALDGGLRNMGIDRARIAARKSYPTKANWKLVIENFFECYHCRPSHPEYFRLNAHEPWTTGASDPGGLDKVTYGIARRSIFGGRKTLSEDGQPVSCLMGGRSAYDGGETSFSLGRLSFVYAVSDHATLFQMIPRSATETDVVVTWLVDNDADADIDTDPITWMWDVTTVQDKKIVEDNANGVASKAYRPGPYTALEDHSSFFVQAYLAEMRSLITGERTDAPVGQSPIKGFGLQRGEAAEAV
ncbi:aromatic ring-hydroxylating dioxygenase subunit alpha [Mesorhizobium sp.]|uniref:aromatic ring-hydroxylating oxygenase subunit alpha n=1 Tax=Mesorhizobium sp. TaxID=1871066 RepID=UPI001204456F|nr:aromatic ring-hydroxylating dioxygenase subunit alpha [Mesorhizobium sp.]TIP11044.1 MAG: aromatic ring-hydroxylating dioxygenase subunit alpha [Mesorhizobium sp.]